MLSGLQSSGNGAHKLGISSALASFIGLGFYPTFHCIRLTTVHRRFDEMHGSDDRGHAVEDIPHHILESIKRNRVCLKGTLFTPLIGENTSNQSLNVQLRKQLDLHVNLVHGFSIPGIKTRHEGIDIVVIR